MINKKNTFEINCKSPRIDHLATRRKVFKAITNKLIDKQICIAMPRVMEVNIITQVPSPVMAFQTFSDRQQQVMLTVLNMTLQRFQNSIKQRKKKPQKRELIQEEF